MFRAIRLLAVSLFALGLSAAPLKYTYWVEPCTDPASLCQPGDPQLAQWAFEAWQKASGGELEFTRVADRGHARIRLYWASAEQGMYGETRPMAFEGHLGAEVFVRPSPMPVNGDKLLRDAIVYLTCLHETGHALGLAHTAVFADIMYSFQFGGDIEEYFGRYRRKLTTRADIAKNSGMSEADRARLLEILKN
jgi:Matrixin